MRRALLILMLLAGCKQDMAQMPRLDPLARALGFPHDAAALLPPEGTVARHADLSPVPDALPDQIPLAMLERGRERYAVFCAPCHSPTGDGDGMIVRRGFPAPPSYHDPGLIRAPDRHFYDVITNGYGAMFSYASRVPPADRWAIIAYIRALQLSQRAPVALADAGLAEGEE